MTMGVRHSFEKIQKIPELFVNFSKIIYEDLVYEKLITKKWSELSVSETTLGTVEKSVSKQVSINPSPIHIFPREKQIVKRIKSLTSERNKNNVTRTVAYLQFYLHHNEVHWAFLAHMVSRNGGYNMTDLKGEIIGNLLTNSEKKHYFSMLEKANGAIFYDAYSQLLLYEESKKVGKSLFHLLPIFGVSKFMIPIWEIFFTSRDSKLLTIALIINEQHFIEKRIVQNAFFQKNVFTSWKYAMQGHFHLTKVILPYYRKNKIRIAGLTVTNFTSVKERIDIGKKLYLILFGIPVIHEGCKKFTENVIHSGSREDYYSSFFDHKVDNSSKLYSPKLEEVWENVYHIFSEDDWLTTNKVMNFFSPACMPKHFDITLEYDIQVKKWLTIKKLGEQVF